MPEYIEKIRVAVRVSQPGLGAHEGYLSLAPLAEFHAGPETLLERFNARDRVIPLERVEDGSVVLLTRAEIEWVAPRREVNRDLICPHSYRVTREEHVRVCFGNGAEMEGLIQMELPDHLNRASDFLNASEDFFPLLTSAGVVLVNKLRVSRTLVYESSPLPVIPEAGEARG